MGKKKEKKNYPLAKTKGNHVAVVDAEIVKENHKSRQGELPHMPPPSDLTNFTNIVVEIQDKINDLKRNQEVALERIAKELKNIGKNSIVVECNDGVSYRVYEWRPKQKIKIEKWGTNTRKN